MAPRLATLRAAANQRHLVMSPRSITKGVHMERAIVLDPRTALDLQPKSLQNGLPQFAFHACRGIAHRCATIGTVVFATIGPAANQRSFDNAPSVMAPCSATLRAAANQRQMVTPTGPLPRVFTWIGFDEARG
jgi:hypothetical protein